MCRPTIVMALTEELQKPKEILSELIILQYFGTWGQEMRLTVPFDGQRPLVLTSAQASGFA